MTRTFDRLVHFDRRSRKYPIRELVAGKKPRSYTWSCPVCLDQGSEGACTGFSVAQEAAARPVQVPDITNSVAREIYHRARQLDPWPGEDYEGSSVLAAMKAGKERGWYDSYRWSFDIQDLILAVGHCGPAVLGIPWYEGMMEPDQYGLVYPTGKKLGGHAILCNGIRLGNTPYHNSSFRLHNSWGPKWGKNGDCFILAWQLDTLLNRDGEACIPVVRRMG